MRACAKCRWDAAVACRALTSPPCDRIDRPAGLALVHRARMHVRTHTTLSYVFTRGQRPHNAHSVNKVVFIAKTALRDFVVYDTYCCTAVRWAPSPFVSVCVFVCVLCRQKDLARSCSRNIRRRLLCCSFACTTVPFVLDSMRILVEH